jgi:hypothetical protein
MEYRGKSYTILQAVEPDTWKWTVDLDDQNAKSGTAKTRAAAMTSVVMLVDKALARRK